MIVEVFNSNYTFRIFLSLAFWHSSVLAFKGILGGGGVGSVLVVLESMGVVVLRTKVWNEMKLF